LCAVNVTRATNMMVTGNGALPGANPLAPRRRRTTRLSASALCSSGGRSPGVVPDEVWPPRTFAVLPRGAVLLSLQTGDKGPGRSAPAGQGSPAHQPVLVGPSGSQWQFRQAAGEKLALGGRRIEGERGPVGVAGLGGAPEPAQQVGAAGVHE